MEEFHSDAVRAYQQGLYVSAVFLSGGTLEGLLAFALKRREAEAVEEYNKKNRTSRPLTEWALNDLVDVALKLKLIGEGSAKAAQAVRDFRNLIHPGKLLRRSRPRWDALATMGLAAVAEVSRSLSGRMST